MKKTYENNNNNFHGNKSLVYIPIFNCNLNTLINEKCRSLFRVLNMTFIKYDINKYLIKHTIRVDNCIYLQARIDNEMMNHQWKQSS